MKEVAGILCLFGILWPARLGAGSCRCTVRCGEFHAVSPEPVNLKPHARIPKPGACRNLALEFELGGGICTGSCRRQTAPAEHDGFSTYADYRIFPLVERGADLSGAYNINSVNGNTQLYTLMFGARFILSATGTRSLLLARC